MSLRSGRLQVAPSGEAGPSRRRFLAAAGAGLALCAFGTRGTGAEGRALRRAQRLGAAMGAKVRLVALHADQNVAERALDDALAELGRIERILSIYRADSDVSRLNRDGRLDRPAPELVAVLRRCAEVSDASEGAFDVTVQPLWEVYEASRKRGRLPQADAVRAALARVGWRDVVVAEDRICFAKPGMAVTLNAIAQGYAADCVAAVLAARGVRDALIDTGELGGIGRREDGAPWAVGIQHPRVADAYAAVARLEGKFMATSGDYRTAFIDDRREHHIFDPRTGHSPATLASMTVVAASGADADALATAALVLGAEKGASLVKFMGAEALWVTKEGQVAATAAFPIVPTPESTRP